MTLRKLYDNSGLKMSFIAKKINEQPSEVSRAINGVLIPSRKSTYERIRVNVKMFIDKWITFNKTGFKDKHGKNVKEGDLLKMK